MLCIDVSGVLHTFFWNVEHEIEFNTCNGTTTPKTGVTAQIAEWYDESDYVNMVHSPELMSMGHRCLLHGFTSVWVNKKDPVFSIIKFKNYTGMTIENHVYDD